MCTGESPHAWHVLGSLEVGLCVAVGSVSPPSDCVKIQVILCVSVVTVFTPLTCELRVGFSGQLRAVSGT